MTNLETMQREGREGLKKFEQYEADGYGYTVDGQTEMDDLYKASNQHTANTYKAGQESVIETLKDYGVNAPRMDCLILNRHELHNLLKQRQQNRG